MKIAKSQLKQIIREELAEAIKIGGSGITMKPPTPEDKAFKKLREVMGLVEKAMLYMTGDEETGQNPTEVIEMVRNIVSESITEYGGAILVDVPAIWEQSLVEPSPQWKTTSTPLFRPKRLNFLWGLDWIKK